MAVLALLGFIAGMMLADSVNYPPVLYGLLGAGVVPGAYKLAEALDSA